MIITRQDELRDWLTSHYKQDLSLIAINTDASFRKYYRTSYDNSSMIVVDSPPTKENNQAFIGVQKILSQSNVNVPKIIRSDLKNGFLLLEDFGDDTLLPMLHNNKTPELLYNKCIEQLIKLQSCTKEVTSKFDYHLPNYSNDLLLFECKLFTDWFLSKYLSIELNHNEAQLLDTVFADVVSSALHQPQLLVHRDYHSRNLMLLANGQVGVIDFQDAVWGPLTYDLVSLYRDCYIAWSIEQIKEWCHNYFCFSMEHHIINNDISFEQYWFWFLKMTLQRNFKTIGIFARLFLRDGKSGYLSDIPRTLNYAIESIKCLNNISRSEELTNLNDFLVNRVVPILHQKNKTYD